jgi:putative PIN family toxin of toxin-antitoxin system
VANRIVIDTNVFIEAVFGEETSDSANLLALLDELDVRLVFSQETIGELMYIFKRHANSLGMSQDKVQDILLDVTTFFQYGKSINTKHLNKTQIKKISDPDDQMFVYAAYASNATHLITLDKKSGILGLTDTPFVCCTPTEFLEGSGFND